MPLCPTCDNRPFATKEALLQHVRTSSNPHPFCLACDRRFSSELAYNAHMAAKHPPTFDCLKCEKQYSSQFALEGHYRGHTDHPNCPVCGKGFYDNTALIAHVREVHNDLWCNTCNLRFETATAANEHYITSPAHPKCRLCGASFRDEDTLEKHLRLHESNAINGRTKSPTASVSGDLGTPTLRSPAYAPSPNSLQSPPTSAVSSTVFSPPSSTSTQPKELPPLQPGAVHGFIPSPPSVLASVSTPLAAHNGSGVLGGTGFSPLSPKPNIFNKDLRRVATIDTTMRVDSPDIHQMLNHQHSPLLNVQAPSFSPIGLPRPGKQIDELWSSRENVQVPRSRLPRQPGFQAPFSVISPPAWSNPGTSIPSGITSQQIAPFPQPYRLQGLPPRHRPASELGDVPTPTSNQFPILNGGNHNSSTISEPRQNVLRAEHKFNPRLYPGSARYVASQKPPSTMNAPIAPSHRGSMSVVPAPSGQYPTFDSFGSSYDLGVRQHPPSILSLPLPFSPPERQNSAIRISPPRLDSLETQYEPAQKRQDLQPEAVLRETMEAQKASIEEHIPLVSAVSTPRLVSDLPLQNFGVKPGNDSYPNDNGSLPSPSTFSTDFSTVSSVSSGMLQEPSPTPMGRTRWDLSRSRSRATSSARSDISSLNIPTYKVTECSQRPSPTSPDVVSPVGLAALPSISPLGPSPIDLDRSFDIPEAQHPLPESVPASPSTLNDLAVENTPETSPMKLKEELENDFRDPEENNELHSPANGDCYHSLLKNHLESSPPSSPQSFVTSKQELAGEIEGLDAPLASMIPEQSRSASRAASVHNVLVENPKPDVNHEAEPDMTAKSPSATPSPVLATPKAEDDMTLPQLDLSSHLAEGEFGKQQQRRFVAPSLGVTPNISIASTTASDTIGCTGSSSSLPSLQCRACRRDTPDDITATMCGHVFCNRCIVDAVIKTSRCPFCSTPTLLYCLFRLDLAT